MTAAAVGIAFPDQAEKQDELVALLTKAYWMEIETVISYIANSVSLGGVHLRGTRERLGRTSTKSSPRLGNP